MSVRAKLLDNINFTTLEGHTFEVMAGSLIKVAPDENLGDWEGYCFDIKPHEYELIS